MKKLFTFAFLMCCIIQTAYSMIPGPPLLVECPKCGKEKELMSIISGNTFGAKQWSDLYLDAPMLPRLSPVQKCAECGTYYLLSKAKNNHASADSFSSDTGRLTFPEIKEALALLREDSLSKEDEMDLRLEFLHRYNDPYRVNPEEYDIDITKILPTRSDEDINLHKENLQALISLLDSTSDNDIPIIAELYRESGDFDSAISIVAHYKPTSDFIESFLKKLVEKAKEKDDMVFLIID